MTGNSISVIKLDELDYKFKDCKDFSLDKQKTLDKYVDGITDYFFPQTNIKYINSDDKFYYYSVSLSTEIVKENIYIYYNELEEYTHGYQKIKKFDFRICKNFEYMYIFTPKKIADQFIKRLVKEKYIHYSEIHFNFSKVQELDKLNVAWGVWKNSKGIIKRIAEFGKGITFEIEDYSEITTFYIDYNYRGNIVQLILSLECRISTQNNLKNSDMIILYNEIKNTLLE